MGAVRDFAFRIKRNFSDFGEIMMFSKIVSTRFAAQEEARCASLILDLRDATILTERRKSVHRDRSVTQRVCVENVEVVAPNFSRRLSGVSSTLLRVLRVQDHQISIATVGARQSDDVPTLRYRDLLGLRRKPRWGGFRVWHARRNIEMLAGLILRDCFQFPLRLIFTSASQRTHTKWTRVLISRMDIVVATSPASSAYLRRSSIIIGHGVDAREFVPCPRKDLARAALRLPNLRFVGCFGRIRAGKGSDVFVDALLPVLAERPDVGAVLVGRATSKHMMFYEGLKNKIREAGLADRLLIMPEVPIHEMPQWYRALDVYVAPQRWEGFGVTPLEAMATAIPVVATNVGAFPSILTPDTGILVGACDVEAMSKAVATLLDNPADAITMAQAGRKRVLSEFSLDIESRRLNAIYRELSGRGELCLNEGSSKFKSVAP